ncbi:uncharacterized protein LOC105703776, partial [Orussus abietinus]|uniref:uncharacterized protein LOC105703776 n=1 Tax=Orussus abietinus TaxID=222816 RepID=UPI000C716227
RTHDSSYTLYRLGERLSPGARQYVETGRADGLDVGGDSPSTLHSFTGPPIPQGEGTSVARAFLDGNHSLVSIFARINPSPDWFVGVDSFQLCVEGNWVDTVTVELDPLDGGTDNGFTFTAANWPTQPQGIAYRISSRYPAHPAGSFYYPNLLHLPTIATLTFTKMREYTLTETYHEDDVVEVEFVSKENVLGNSPTPRGTDPNRDLNEAIAEERREMDFQKFRYWTAGSGPPVTNPPDNKGAMTGSEGSMAKHGRFLSTPPSHPFTRVPQYTSDTKSRGTPFENRGSWYLRRNTNPNPAEAYRVQILQDFQRKANGTNMADGERLHRLRTKHHRLLPNGKRLRIRPHRDCKVGEWGPWSACSRTCGVGETQRTRKVTVKPRRGGSTCPPLKETKWCGSVSPCNLENEKPNEDVHQW